MKNPVGFALIVATFALLAYAFVLGCGARYDENLAAIDEMSRTRYRITSDLVNGQTVYFVTVTYRKANR